MDRYKETKRATLISLIANIFLLIIKIIIGIITNSLAMLSDAFNSAGDILSTSMAYIGNKIASKGADEDHNLGHGKAEYLFSLLISITMIVVSFELCISSIKSIFNNETYQFSIFLVVVCIITIITKFTLYLICKKAYKNNKNILLLSTAMDHRNDCFLTLMNLLACSLSYFGYREIDGVVGALLSLWILRTGLQIFKMSYDTLMDKSMSKELKNKIIDIVKKYPEIEKYNHLNSTPVGYQYQISITIFVDGNMSTYDSHEIANNLEKEITNIDEIYLTIVHVNPINSKVKGKTKNNIRKN